MRTISARSAGPSRLLGGPLPRLHACRASANARSGISTATAPPAAAAAAAAAQQKNGVAQLLQTLTAPGMEVMQLEVHMDDLELLVRRASTPVATAVAPAAAPVLAPTPRLQPALHLAPAPYASMSVASLDEDDVVDEALLAVTANRVGTFRAKGKVKVGDQVQKGQVLGAIEQLGTLVDVKAPQAGEVAALKVADGDPVEYGGALVLLAPAFGVEIAGITTNRGL